MGLKVREAASEKLINSGTRASAPMSCNEHIWPFSLFGLCLNLLCTSNSSWRKSIAVPPVSISGRHLTTSAKVRSHIQTFRQTQQLSSAQQEKSGDRKSHNKNRSVCFHIWQAGYIVPRIKKGGAESNAVRFVNRTEGWEWATSSSGVTTLSEMNCVNKWWCFTLTTKIYWMMWIIFIIFIIP